MRCSHLFDRIILVSNHSDAEPALQAIKQDFPHRMIGVVMPIKPITSGSMNRSVSRSLSNTADWIHHEITDSQLQQAPLPEKISTRKKPIKKPDH